MVIDAALAIESSLSFILDMPYGTDLVLDDRSEIKGWLDPTTRTLVWLSDASIVPNFKVIDGEVIEISN